MVKAPSRKRSAGDPRRRFRRGDLRARTSRSGCCASSPPRRRRPILSGADRAGTRSSICSPRRCRTAEDRGASRAVAEDQSPITCPRFSPSFRSRTGLRRSCAPGTLGLEFGRTCHSAEAGLSPRTFPPVSVANERPVRPVRARFRRFGGKRTASPARARTFPPVWWQTNALPARTRTFPPVWWQTNAPARPYAHVSAGLVANVRRPIQ